MERDNLFAADDRIVLRKYSEKNKELFLELWEENFANSSVKDIVMQDANLTEKTWNDMFGADRLSLTIYDKHCNAYVGEITLRNLGDAEPEPGIQLLKRYQGMGIGTRVMKLFLEELRNRNEIKSLFVRIASDNIISQRMATKFGAVPIGEEGKDKAELFEKIMLEMGKEKFEEIIPEGYEFTQKYIICYRIKI